ncbi:hypothetical protein, conserved [Angomonas deanei]|uniref:Uncharacterized protein n=1 Tax=Angomonas deanei TaxID=59799 RepID=A0A7G2CNV0_9TRYP|nr:hypothetical protein, conserved [Angomonas deanei]
MADRVRDEDIDELQRQLNERTAELEAEVARNRDLEAQLRELQKQAGNSVRAVDDSAEEIRKLQAALDELANRVRDEDVDELMRELNERTAQLEAEVARNRDLEAQLRGLQKQSSDNQNAAEEIRRLQAALDEMADRVRDEDVDELQRQLGERTAELETEVERNRDLAANGRTLEAEIVELCSQVAALESRLAAKEAEVGVSSQQSEAAVASRSRTGASQRCGRC